MRGNRHGCKHAWSSKGVRVKLCHRLSGSTSSKTHRESSGHAEHFASCRQLSAAPVRLQPPAAAADSGWGQNDWGAQAEEDGDGVPNITVLTDEEKVRSGYWRWLQGSGTPHFANQAHLVSPMPAPIAAPACLCQPTPAPPWQTCAAERMCGTCWHHSAESTCMCMAREAVCAVRCICFCRAGFGFVCRSQLRASAMR